MNSTDCLVVKLRSGVTYVVGSRPPSPQWYAPCLFYREKDSALSSLVDPRRIVCVPTIHCCSGLCSQQLDSHLCTGKWVEMVLIVGLITNWFGVRRCSCTWCVSVFFLPVDVQHTRVSVPILPRITRYKICVHKTMTRRYYSSTL